MTRNKRGDLPGLIISDAAAAASAAAPRDRPGGGLKKNEFCSTFSKIRTFRTFSCVFERFQAHVAVFKCFFCVLGVALGIQINPSEDGQIIATKLKRK